MKIINETFPLKDEEVSIQEAAIAYNQNSCVEKDGSELIEIKKEDSGSGAYIVIKTDRWTINDIDEIITLLTDFKTRAGIL